jgi:hypothetical protein
MALKRSIEFEGSSFIQTDAGCVNKGIEKISFVAYIKVIAVTGDKTEIVASVNFSDLNQNLHKKYVIPVSVLDGAKNFIAQAYEHLKTLPEFSGAIDC